MVHLGITIDLNRDKLLSDFAKTLLKKHYMRADETSPQEAFARASVAFCAGDMEFAQRIYDYSSKLWFMFASPVLSNAVLPGEKIKALPISCFLQYVPDSIEGLINHTVESRWLSVLGGGVGGHWSDVRSLSEKSPSPIPFLHTIDADVIAYAQGKTRRGAYAAYLDVSHPDILEFLHLRVPTGDIQRKAFNIHHAVNVTDKFMRAVLSDDDWDLVDPNDGATRHTMKARDLWTRILEIRFRTGEPYILFIDTANKHLPYFLKEQGLRINGSNLCIEIMEPTTPERTAVCCLSSLNGEKYEEWEDTHLVRDLITLLDNILQVFIENAPPELHKAVYSATQERSIGLGLMGFHSFLQSKSIPFESPAAIAWNKRIFSHIQNEAEIQTMCLGDERGPCPDGRFTGRRNSHLLAIAPNANNSIIVGTSPSIEAWEGNAFTHRTRVGSHLVKNKHLEEVLSKYGENTEEIWTSIITEKGSVQHLCFLSEWEKKVFKTAKEIDQMWVIQHASDRQKFICQSQSLNLFFSDGADKSYVNDVHIQAWKKGVKSLYYLRTQSRGKAENVSEKIELKAINNSECVACEA